MFLFSYCDRIVGKDKTLVEMTDKTTGKVRTAERWSQFKNYFVNAPKPVVLETDNGQVVRTVQPLNREDVVKLVAVKGYATAYVLKDDTLRKGRSAGSNTLGACMMMVDFDNTWSIEEAQQHPWWSKVWFAYTTPSYGGMQGPLDEQDLIKLPKVQYEAMQRQVGLPKRNFRLVFRFHRMLSADELLEVAAGFMSVFPLADQSCIDAARIMFGSVNARTEMPEEEYHLNEADIQALCSLGAVWRVDHNKEQRQRIATHGGTTFDAGDGFSGDTVITLASGDQWTVRELFETRPLGWKEACYSPFRHESTPSAFVTRFTDNGNLFVFDSGSRQKKVFRAEERPPAATLTLKRKEEATDGEEVEPREQVTIVPVKKMPARKAYTPKYGSKLSVEERRQQIKKTARSLADHNLFFAPEGFGKSYITMALTSMIGKVLFACQTNAQAKQKAEEFRQLKHNQPGFPQLEKPRVQCCLSRDFLFQEATGVAVVKKDSADPFEAPVADKEETLEAYMLEHGCSLQVAEAVWQECYEEALVETPDFHSYSIIVTTMARAEVLAKAGHFKEIDDGWVIIYDDPGFAEMSNLVPVTAPREARIIKANEQREAKGLEPLKITKKAFGDRVYYVRPEDKRMGMSFPAVYRKDVGWRKPPVIFTTTEELTRFMIESICPDIKVSNYMHELEVHNVTIWGTSLVHKKNDGLIILAVELLRREFPEEQISLIGDGLGQQLNHVNNKGQNNLTTQNIVIELSQLHPSRKQHIVDEVAFLTNGKTTLTDRDVQTVFMRDQMHQAIGRNSGYREKDGGYQTVVLCDPHYFDSLADTCRYRPREWSCQLDIGSGASVRSKVNHKKRAREILNYRGTMPEMLEVMQDLVSDPENIFQHQELREAIQSVAKIKGAKKRVYEALATQMEKNQHQNAMLDDLMALLVE